jgi:hypothetical protein
VCGCFFVVLLGGNAKDGGHFVEELLVVTDNVGGAVVLQLLLFGTLVIERMWVGGWVGGCECLNGLSGEIFFALCQSWVHLARSLGCTTIATGLIGGSG